MMIDVITTTSNQFTLYGVDYCSNDSYVYQTYANIPRAECVLTCLNYDGCFGVVMTDLPKSPDIVTSCQLKRRGNDWTQRCPYSVGTPNYYHTQACPPPFTPYGSKCYKSETSPAIAAQIDAECRKKYVGARAVLPRNQEELDEVIGFLRFMNYNTRYVFFDYKEVDGDIYIRDGPRVNFTRSMWHMGEPNGVDEKCVCLFANTMEFVDIICTAKGEYVCVMDSGN